MSICFAILIILTMIGTIFIAIDYSKQVLSGENREKTEEIMPCDMHII
jgi:hypothetical protein